MLLLLLCCGSLWESWPVQWAFVAFLVTVNDDDDDDDGTWWATYRIRQQTSWDRLQLRIPVAPRQKQLLKTHERCARKLLLFLYYINNRGGAENDGHEIAGHENARHENAGQIMEK